MKSFFLPVLSWALAISPIFAQKQLPVSIQPYAVNWSYAVKQMFDAAGYEVPGPKPTFELLPAVESRSAELQLDSTISYFGYGSSSQDSTPLFRNVYTYPETNVQVITEYFYDLDHWTALSRTALISDELGRLVSTLAQLYDAESGTFIPDSQIELFRHGNSPELIDSFFVYAWSAELQAYQRQLSTWNTFDEQSRLHESISSIEIFQLPLRFLDRYQYSIEGDLTLIESFNLDGAEEIPSGRQEFWYTDHLLNSTTTLVSDGERGFLPQYKTEYTYTDFRKEDLVKSFDYDPEKNDWTLNQTTGYGYDDNALVNLKEEVTLTGTGLWERHLERYTYLKDEYLRSEAGYVYDNNLEDWVKEDAQYYFYSELSANDPVGPIEDYALFLYPNPSTGIVHVKLEGNVTVYVYSLAGQLLKRITVSHDNQAIDLGNLPAGLYQVRAKKGEDYYSGKLILQ